MREYRGPWQQVSRCKNCGYVSPVELKWMDSFFVPVCPGCGENNTNGGAVVASNLFEPVKAREVRRGVFRRFARWEFKDRTV